MFSHTLLVEILAIIFSTISGTINLVVAVTIVPFWKSLKPEDFLDWFGRYSKLFGSMSAPVTLLAIVFTGWSMVSGWNNRIVRPAGFRACADGLRPTNRSTFRSAT